MNEEQEANASASPIRVMRRFVHCVDDGDVRQELAEDSILNFLGRTVKGGNAVTGYMRTQLAGRFRHVGFQEAHKCSVAKETAIKERFARSFQVLRRHLKASKNIPPSMHSRAESDDEADDAIDEESRPNPSMVTPPRSTTADPGTELMQYIESVGVLDAIHEQNDGGIYLGESCQVTLTLGYRCTPLLYKTECAVEICLVVYEKFRQRTLPRSTASRSSGMHRHQRTRSPRSTHTDDETEVPAPRSVRRMLFSATCDDSEESLGVSSPDVESQSPSLPALTPRKRQHKSDSNVKTKRSTGHGGMRF